MRRINTFFFSIVAICASLTAGLDTFGQGKNIDKTYRWKINVDPQGHFTFNNYDCDLTIHTCDKPEIQYALSVDATLKSEEDASRLDGYIGGLEFSQPSGGVQFDNRFWTKRVNTKFKKTITLNGEVYLDLYNDRLFGNNVNSKIHLIAKYSTLEFKKMKDIEADLYNTDIETGEIGNLVVLSKYSNLKAGDAGRVNINAYNDKYTFGNNGDLKFIDKYSDLKAVNTGHLNLDCYNSTVSVSTAEEVDLNSKYGKYELAGARSLKITSAYNDNYKIEKLGALDKSLSYKFVADVKYGKLDINEEVMNVKKMIKDGPQLEMEAIKGIEKEGMPAFFVNGYEIAVTLTDQL